MRDTICINGLQITVGLAEKQGKTNHPEDYTIVVSDIEEVIEHETGKAITEYNESELLDIVTNYYEQKRDY